MKIITILSRVAEIKSVRKDFALGIITIILAIAATQVFSIKQGLYFAMSIFKDETTSYIALGLNELIVFTFLGLAIKFILQNAVLWKIVISVFMSVVFMGVSFYATTSGYSQKKSDAIDTTEIVKRDYKNEIDSIQQLQQTEIEQTKSTAQLNINLCDTAIAEIQRNPDGWKNGKRTIITKEQKANIATYRDKKIQIGDQLNSKVKEIQKYYDNKIQLLKTESKEETSEIKAVATAEGLKYWYVAAAIQSIQIILNFTLMFLFIKVLNEEKPSAQRQIKINEAAQKVQISTDEMIDTIVETAKDLNKEIIRTVKAQSTLNNQTELPQQADTSEIDELLNEDDEEKESIEEVEEPKENGIGFNAIAQRLKNFAGLNQSKKSVNQYENDSLNGGLNQSKNGLNQSKNSLNQSKKSKISLNDKKYLSKYKELANDILKKDNSGLSISEIYKKHNVSRATYFNVKRIIDNI